MRTVNPFTTSMKNKSNNRMKNKVPRLFSFYTIAIVYYIELRRIISNNG